MQKIKAVFGMVAVIACLAGCAGGQRKVAADMEWDEWAVKYKSLLTQYQKAKEPSDVTNVISGLSQLATRTQEQTAKAMIVQDLCIISGAFGDGATVKYYNCASASSLGVLVRGE